MSTSAKLLLFHLAVFGVTNAAVAAEKKYDVGASDAEIKIGQTQPYSGPMSSYGVLGKTLEAYFRMVNDNGGINGRKLKLISYDDAYSPGKTVEQTRKLVESDEVLFLFYSVGTAPNAAVQKYLNSRKIPQLLVYSGHSRWGNPKEFPWSMGWGPTFRSESRIYATYILKNFPNAKIGILYQNDDFGKEHLAGLREVLGENADHMIVRAVPYDTSMPTVDSLITTIFSAKPDIFLDYSTPKFAAQAIKKTAELGWHPIHILANASQSIGAVIEPAGFENAQGIISSAYQKDPTDSQWDADAGMRGFKNFLSKYMPGADKSDSLTLNGYSAATGLKFILEQCGDNLTRENVMRQAANLDLRIDTYLPGVQVKTSPTDFYPVEQLQLMKLEGKRFVRFGEVIDSHDP